MIAYDPAATSPDRLLVALAGTPSGGRAAPPEQVEPGRTVPERGAPSWLALVGTTLALGASLTPTAAPALLALTVASIAPAIVRAGRALRAGRLDVDVLQALGLVLLVGRGNFAAANLPHVARPPRPLRAGLHGDAGAALAPRAAATAGRSALRVERGQPVPVPMAVLAPGDLVSVGAGERLPADGVVASGEGLVDQQAITGEGLPVERRRGDRVFAWSVLEEGRLLVRVEHAGSGTVVGRIVEAVEASAGEKPELQVFAERLADRLVGRTLLLAIAGAAVSRRLDAGTAMLVSDYGLAARVALPTAVLAAIIRASRAGILVKGPRVIEELARVDTVVFDKTGTLTRGAPAVSRVVALGATEEPEEVLRLAAAAGSRIPHPVARAIARAAARRRIPVVSTQAELREGLGVRAMVEGVPCSSGAAASWRSRGYRCRGARPGQRRRPTPPAARWPSCLARDAWRAWSCSTTSCAPMRPAPSPICAPGGCGTW